MLVLSWMGNQITGWVDGFAG